MPLVDATPHLTTQAGQPPSVRIQPTVRQYTPRLQARASSVSVLSGCLVRRGLLVDSPLSRSSGEETYVKAGCHRLICSLWPCDVAYCGGEIVRSVSNDQCPQDITPYLVYCLAGHARRRLHAPRSAFLSSYARSLSTSVQHCSRLQRSGRIHA